MRGVLGMNKKEFKKSLANVLSEFGFTTKNNSAKIENDKLIIIVTTQKSNYENCYYINYGFLIKELSPELANPKDNQCDVFGRLGLTINGEQHNTIDFEKITLEDFSEALRISLKESISPVIDFGLMKYFEMFPTATSTVRLKARKYLGLIASI